MEVLKKLDSKPNAFPEYEFFVKKLEEEKKL